MLKFYLCCSRYCFTFLKSSCLRDNSEWHSKWFTDWMKFLLRRSNSICLESGVHLKWKWLCCRFVASTQRADLWGQPSVKTRLTRALLFPGYIWYFKLPLRMGWIWGGSSWLRIVFSILSGITALLGEYFMRYMLPFTLFTFWLFALFLCILSLLKIGTNWFLFEENLNLLLVCILSLLLLVMPSKRSSSHLSRSGIANFLWFFLSLNGVRILCWFDVVSTLVAIDEYLTEGTPYSCSNT